MAYTPRVRVEWDEEKDRRNRRKHGISFEEVRQLFSAGEDYLVLFDDEHSLHEDRFIAIGRVEDRVVVVVWTEDEAETVRIISARRATRGERALLHAHWRRFP